jgi:rubredoxin
MKDNEYKCGHCGNVYEKGWTDEEAKKEAEEIFGKHPDDWNDGQVVICDDCFNLMNPKNHPDLLEKTKEVI